MCSLKLCVSPTARVNHPSGRSMKIISLKNPQRKRLRDVGNTAPGCSLGGNWEVENSIIFDGLPWGKPSQLDQCHWMTPGKDWQLPKQSCYSSWHTLGVPAASCRSWEPQPAVSRDRFCMRKVTVPREKGIYPASATVWHWDVILFVLNQLRFRLEWCRWFSHHTDKCARRRILAVCISCAYFTPIKIPVIIPNIRHVVQAEEHRLQLGNRSQPLLQC